MKNKHGNGYSNTIGILNTLRELDEEQITLYKKYNDLILQKLCIRFMVLGVVTLAQILNRKEKNNGRSE